MFWTGRSFVFVIISNGVIAAGPSMRALVLLVIAQVPTMTVASRTAMQVDVILRISRTPMGDGCDRGQFNGVCAFFVASRHSQVQRWIKNRMGTSGGGVAAPWRHCDNCA